MEQNVSMSKLYRQMGDVNMTLYPSMSGLHYQTAPYMQPIQQLTNNKPEQIDKLVAIELQHLKTHYADEERRYVDQMLLENPIIVERRAAPKPKLPNPSATASNRDIQYQRAESCRKSRYNNKIKKAKLRFRHKFVCNQLTESANVLEYMQEVIAQAEAHLLAYGFNRSALERMRQNFGVERDVIRPHASMAATGTATDKSSITGSTTVDKNS